MAVSKERIIGVFNDNRFILLCLALVFALVIFFIDYTSWWMDVDHYWYNINDFYVDGKMPYKDYVFEYPPFSLVVFLIPRIFSVDLDSFHYSFAIFAAISYIVASWLILDIVGKENPLRTYVVIILLLIPIFSFKFIVTRNDVFAVTMAVLAVWLFLKDKKILAYVVISLGAMIKIYPIIFVMGIVIYYLAKKDWRSTITCIAVVAITCLVIELPFFISDPSSAFNYLTYHSDRGIQIESVVASLIYLVYLLGLTTIEHEGSYGSDNIVGDLPDAIAPHMNQLLMMALIGFAVWMLFREIKRNKAGSDDDDNSFSRFMCLVFVALTLFFIVFSKVYSAQYMIWVLLLAPLVVWASSEGIQRTKAFWVTMAFGFLSMIAFCLYDTHSSNDLLFFSGEALKNIATVVYLVMVLRIMNKRYIDQ